MKYHAYLLASLHSNYSLPLLACPHRQRHSSLLYEFMQTASEGGCFWENERLAVTGLSAVSWLCLCEPKDQGRALLICTGMRPINKSRLERPNMSQSNVIVWGVDECEDVECVWTCRKSGGGTGQTSWEKLLANKCWALIRTKGKLQKAIWSFF